MDRWQVFSERRRKYMYFYSFVLSAVAKNILQIKESIFLILILIDLASNVKALLECDVLKQKGKGGGEIVYKTSI